MSPRMTRCFRCALAWALLLSILGSGPLGAQEIPTPPAAPDAAGLPPRVPADLPPAAPSGEQHGFVRVSGAGGEIVRVGASAHVGPEDSVRELVVVFGNATVEGEVRGDMVVVWGDAVVNGRVGGDLVSVFGKTTLGPKARIEGECVVVGAEMIRDAAAVLASQPVEVNLGGLMYWLKNGLFLGRPIAPGLWWCWVAVVIHFLLYLLILLVAPRPVEACWKSLDTQFLASFGAGLVGFILLAPLLTIVAATGIGLLLIPFLILAFIGAVLLGKAAVLQFLGGQLNRRVDPDAAPHSLLAFVVGFLLVTALYLVPVLGLLVWGTLPILGLGAAVLAAIQAMRRTGRAPAIAPSSAAALAVPGAGATAGGTSAVTNEAATLPPALIGSAPRGSTDAPSASAAELAALPCAGFWIRFAASLLDLVLLGWVFAFLNGYFPLVWLAYHIGMWTWKGTTIGGIVCGLKVVRLDGRPLDFTVALVRGLAAVFSFIALCIGFFWVGWTRERQAWHDLIAGTVIVRVPRGVSLI